MLTVDSPSGSFVAVRWLPVAFLLTQLVARCADGLRGTDIRYVPFVVAVFAMPLWYATGLARRPWRTAPWALLAVQAVLTYLPFVVLGDGWVGGVSGHLIGLVLLVAPRWPWQLALLLLVVEGVLWNVVLGPPYLPAINGGTWVLIAAADSALGLFGLVRVAQVTGELAATQDELARAAVLRERLGAGERLVGAVEDRLRSVARHARSALRWLSTTPEDARNEMEAAGRIAREAVSEGRRVYDDRVDAPGLPVGTAPTPPVARAVLATVLVLFAMLNLLNVFAPSTPPAGRYERPLTLVVAMLVTVAVPLLHWRHSGAGRGGSRPRYWPVTLAVQAVLCYLQFAMIGTVGLIFVAFLVASVLLLVAGPWRWVWFAVVLLSLPILGGWNDLASMSTTVLLGWIGYITATITSFGLMAYGLSRLADLAAQLAARRDQLAALATVAERLRLAQDTHDLLGLGMTTLALKTDLVAALIGRDDQRAGRELGELVSLCTTIGADAGRIAGERPKLSLASEFALATDVLAASGMEVTTQRAPVRLAADADTTFAIVLREAVTNVLRHSTAQRCAITLAEDAGTVTLRVSNDGAPPPSDSRGHGLTNMRVRVEALGGVLTIRHSHGTFVVVAELADAHS
nr:putative two-component system sensor kinase [Kibdelosporangium sp. MJ126-NF4]CTQ98374.1 putative two-component system sensor kinase [Kibdelosporangium sp. MJ126-NF4]